MIRSMESYLIKLPIIRRNFDKTNSFKFKGFIEIISNEYGIIKDWKIKFDFLIIDLYTTQSWFKIKNSNFYRREELFSLLSLKQEPRPSLNSNLLYKLTDKEIEITNNYFNDRDSYDSSIKNILSVLKGNNPTGEASNPDSAEMILNLKYNNYISNFTILLDDLIVKDNNYFNLYKLNAKHKDFDFFVNLNDSLKSAFNFMQSKKSNEEFKIYKNEILKYYKNYNEHAVKGNSIAKSERSKYSKNVDMFYSKNKNLPFGYMITDKEDFQKCHIYEFYNIRDQIIKILFEYEDANQKQINLLKDMISDPENFLPLPNEVHRRFDKNLFTYEKNGNILPINEAGEDYVFNRIDNRFKKIDSFYLTDKRLKYLSLRNKLLLNK